MPCHRALGVHEPPGEGHAHNPASRIVRLRAAANHGSKSAAEPCVKFNRDRAQATFSTNGTAILISQDGAAGAAGLPPRTVVT